MWGWRVTTSTNKLDFVDGGTTFEATLRLGVYCAAEFAAEVQRAMRAANTGNQNNTCNFDFATRKFTATGTATFSLLWTGANTCAGLLGFDESADDTGFASYESDGEVGATHSDAFAWVPSDPVHATTPVEAQEDGTAAKYLQRAVQTVQNRADGGKRETIHFSTDKLIRLQLRYLAGTDRDSAEDFLDWIEKGRRFNYQPDKDADKALRLALVNPGELAIVFTWMARDEHDLPELTFVEQLTRA